jgi:hypothetical protein
MCLLNELNGKSGNEWFGFSLNYLIFYIDYFRKKFIFKVNWHISLLTQQILHSKSSSKLTQDETYVKWNKTIYASSFGEPIIADVLRFVYFVFWNGKSCRFPFQLDSTAVGWPPVTSTFSIDTCKSILLVQLIWFLTEDDLSGKITVNSYNFYFWVSWLYYFQGGKVSPCG